MHTQGYNESSLMKPVEFIFLYFGLFGVEEAANKYFGLQTELKVM